MIHHGVWEREIKPEQNRFSGFFSYQQKITPAARFSNNLLPATGCFLLVPFPKNVTGQE